MATREQPVTPSVIRWAIDESGYSLEELSTQLKIPSATLRDWARGDERPNWTQLQKLAAILKRQVAAFFLPERPEDAGAAISFRAPPKAKRKRPNPSELRYVREARRLQTVLSWLETDLATELTSLPNASTESKPERVAGQVRDLLTVSIETQSAWPSASAAFDSWRKRLESLGVYVFLFSLGKGSCKGFSLSDKYAPVIAVNTYWNEAARVFTLFHELGHLITKTNSVCVLGGHQLDMTHGDETERWCERFAANVLIPTEELRVFLKRRFQWQEGLFIQSLDRAKSVANFFKVSLAASTLRLIDIGAAKWDLYSQIPISSDDKRRGGGGGGRVRLVIREDTFGMKTANTFLSAIRKDLLTPYDAMNYLRVSDKDLGAWEERMAAPNVGRP